MGALSTVLGRRLALAAIIWASLLPRGHAGCNETWAVNYNSTDDDFSDCHGPPHHLAFLVPVPPETVAGTHLDPAPVVELRDSSERRVLADGGAVVVTAKYTVVAYRRVTEATATGYRTLDGDMYLRNRSWPVQAEAGRANFSALLPTTAGSYNITFSVKGAAAAVAEVVGSELRVRPASPTRLRMMRQPGGGEECSPLRSQPSLLLKDEYNNTVSLLDGEAIVASLVVGADRPYAPDEGSNLLGTASLNLSAGGVAFGSLGVNTTGTAWRLVFRLDSSAGGGGGGTHLTATSDTFDCHREPVKLVLLDGWPPKLEVTDAGGVRASAVNGAEMRSYLEFPDGGWRQYGYPIKWLPRGPASVATSSGTTSATTTISTSAGTTSTVTPPFYPDRYYHPDGSITYGTSQIEMGEPRRAEDGVWTYTYETDPLKNLTDAAASIALIFRANVSAACCELTLDENNKGVIASLYVPKIRIVRVRALNTGQQGGYGRGDSVEVSFNIKTDRAGLPLREVFDRTVLERLLVPSNSWGDSPAAVSGVWTDNCTLLVVAGRNTSGAALQTGITTVRVRDDILELYDEKRRLRVPSTAESVLMTGTFGAAPGYPGRTDPLREALGDQSMRRYVPRFPSQEGPLVWHPGGTGDTGPTDEFRAGVEDSVDLQPAASVYGISECEAEAPDDSMASFESRYGERWTAIEGYFDANAKRMVYLPDGRPRDELDAAAEERDWFHSHPL